MEYSLAILCRDRKQRQKHRSQARSSDQTDSAGKPTSDVVENLGAAVRKLEDIFVRISVRHHVS